MTQPEPQSEAAPERRKRTPRVHRRRRHFGLLALLFVPVTGVFVSLLLLILVGQSVTAPDWLRMRVQERVNAQMPGVDVQFGKVILVFDQGWRPRILLRDVRVSDAEGMSFVTLSDMETALEAQPLFMEGRFQTNRIALNGLAINLKRTEDGRFDLALGDTQYPVGQGASPGALISGLDAVMATSALADLDQIDISALTIRYEDRQSGRTWVADGGRLRLTRADGALRLRGDVAVLNGGDSVATLELSYQSVIGSGAAEFAVAMEDVRARDVAAQSPAVAWLDVLRAPISGALRGSFNTDDGLGPLSATLQIGAGVVQPDPGARPIPFEAARSYFTYTPATGRLQFDELSVQSKLVSAHAEGIVSLGDLTRGLQQREMVGQLDVSQITANPGDLFDRAMTLERASVDMRLRLNPFELDLGRITLRDGTDLARLSGRLRADATGWRLGLEGQMDELTPERLLDFWPRNVKPKTRTWIETNVHAGDMRDLQFALRATPGARPAVFLGFQFADVSARFMRSMPPVQEASGWASLESDRFAVYVEKGRVPAEEGGDVEVSGTRFIIPDVRVKPAPAEVRLNTQSTITSALSLLDRPPLNYLSKAGQPVTLAEGRATAEGQLNFVMQRGLPPEAVRFAVTARARDVSSATLIKGRVLSAPDLTVEASPTALRVAGKGFLGELPFDATWQTKLGSASDGTAQIKGDVELSDRFLKEFRIALPPGSVSGTGRADVTIDLVKGRRPAFRLGSDLAGVALKVAPLRWSKATGTRAKFDIAGTLASPPTIDEIALDAPGLKLSGALVLTDQGQLERARFNRVQAGGWLDAPIELIGRGAGRAPGMRITGGRVDLRKASLGSGGGGGGAGQGGPLSLALERLQITDTIHLSDFRGDFSTAKGMDGKFTARVNGTEAVTGRIMPTAGGSAFRVLADDAGAVLRASGLFQQAHNGKMDLSLIPTGTAGHYDGALAISDTRLRDAPTMAALLSALSIVGLLEQLGGSGIAFSDVEARFRLTPRQVILTQASAVGASMGLSMDGVYDLTTKAMDMQGVISPIYLINGIGSILTRKGEGLIGFSYRLLGTSAAPQVRVNPLSLFTPGMFREIFRRPAPKVSQ